MLDHLFFLYGARCPKCAKIAKKIPEEFNLELLKKYNNEYVALEQYKGDSVHILIKHNICQNEWLVTPSNILRGFGCPICNESKGEKFIRQVLIKNNILFEPQYVFNDLIGIGGGFLKFDFAIFQNETKIIPNVLVEFDGIFHYKKQYDEDGFETLKIHDKLKDEYCKNHNIPLLRIPYWDFDMIEEILTEYFCKLNNYNNDAMCNS